jgi:glycosyltransferase involved in cell wall biosynthesis
MNSEWTDPTVWLQALLVAALVLLAIPALLAPLYLFWLTLFSRRSPPTTQPSGLGKDLRFDIIVPAHDEAASIAGVVENLLDVDWPKDQFRVLVVADNCQDATATKARQAGARVIERNDPQSRGKGYALQLGFGISLAQRYADAIVVVDADSRASRNLLRAFAAALSGGATVAQAFHGVLHPNQNRRNRLMAIAYSAFHKVRSRGRERLALSCGIRGNGWCISRHTLQAVVYEAHGLAEDIEYGLRLGIAGVRVTYVDDAQVLSSMDTDLAGVASQRNRWEQGRSALPGIFARSLLSPFPGRTRALRRDLGVDLLVPPLATIGLSLVLLTLVGVAADRALPNSIFPTVFLSLGAVSSLALLLHIGRAWQLSGTGRRGLLDLAAAPRFALWKLALRFRPARDTSWVRTHRTTS